MRRGFGTRGTSDGPSGRNARRWGRARCALRTGGIACLLLLDFLRIGDAHAQERLVRRYAADEGLAVPPVTALAQDRQGFLWIGAVGGLYRFDGVEFRRWAPDRLAGAIAQLAAAPDDARLAVQGVDGRIFEIDDGLVSLLPPPPGGRPATVQALAYDARGRLWTASADSALAMWDGTAWTAYPRTLFGGEAVRKLRAAGSALLVMTDAGLWEVSSAGTALRRFDGVVADALPLPPHRLAVLTTDGRLLELVGGRQRELASTQAGTLPQGRAIMLAERNATLWVAMDRFLAAVRPGQGTEWLGPGEGIESGGPILVDLEGSLWLGAFSALLQFPEPETVLWTDRHGLPGRHTRFLARSENVLWVTTWQGTGLVRGTPDGPIVATDSLRPSHTRPCIDASGVLWLATDDAVLRIRGERTLERFPPTGGFTACAPAPDGGLWIATERGLLHASVNGDAPLPVAGIPFGDDARIDAVLHDHAGRLWIAHAERVCHANASTGEPDAWTCDPVPGVGVLSALLEVEPGTIWAATRQAGVLVRDGDEWRQLPANATLASHSIFALAPSPHGGVWIAGHGILQRVRPGGDAGWQLLETPGKRNGLLSIGGGDLLEDDDGALWIATSLGLVHLPPQARFASLDPPPVRLVDASVDAEPVPLQDGLALAADRNRLELRFAALSFREPGSVRYQVRLSPDAPWRDTRGEPSFRWVDLPPGRYVAEVRASLDGRRWSPEPARFAFRVLPPWYRTPWAITLLVATAAAIAWAAYHARLAYLLGLERQRTRIAMDLHDELGSGLGSIGILAGILAGGRADPSQNRRFAEEIATTAEQLGSALSDIVWSLDPRAATLEELASRLAGHAARLFAGDDVEFTLRAPRRWPDVELPLALRRNVLLIGLEALHNAARHAGARNVALAFTRKDRGWELTVRDDGVGIGGGTPTDVRRGRGIAGMRKRAQDMGATIEWSETPGGGTTVSLRFNLPARANRWSGARRRRRRRARSMA